MNQLAFITEYEELHLKFALAHKKKGRIYRDFGDIVGKINSSSVQPNNSRNVKLVIGRILQNYYY